MPLFVAFGTGIANIGRRTRLPIEDRVDAANATLVDRTSGGAQIVAWFGHTGNFVIDAHPDATPSLHTDVQTALAVPCSVVPIEQLQDYVTWLGDLGAPPPGAGVRWSAGLAFLVEGEASTARRATAEGALFERLAHDVVGVWRRRTIDSRDARTSSRAGGGWGAISSALHEQLGGVWTVRSIRSILGVLKRAVEHRSRSSS